MPPVTTKNIFNFFIKDFAPITFVVTSVVYFCAIVFNIQNAFLMYGLLLLNFASFDRIGYHYLAKDSENSNQLISYRILQHGFLIILGISFYMINPLVPFLFFASWLFGVCDFLYFILGKEFKFITYTNMYWLWWCPWSYVGIQKTGKNLTIVSIIVMLISLMSLGLQNGFK
jgi:hypothetical protein